MSDERDIPAPDAHARLRHERAMRFRWLISQVELGARSIQFGGVDDIPLALLQMSEQLAEAGAIMREVSREALDRMKP